jgi:cation transport regulator ChaB
MPRQRLRERERISFVPVWGKEYEGYAANFYRQNMWRCDPINEMKDLIQDAYLVFDKVKVSYPRVIDPKHFMALFKTALTNNMHDKASYKRRKDDSEVYLSSDVSDFFVGRIGEVSNAGYLSVLLDELPEEMKMVLTLMAKGMPPEPKPKRTYGMQPRESLSMQLRRLLRLPINSDPLSIIKRLLTT